MGGGFARRGAVEGEVVEWGRRMVGCECGWGSALFWVGGVCGLWGVRAWLGGWCRGVWCCLCLWWFVCLVSSVVWIGLGSELPEVS